MYRTTETGLATINNDIGALIDYNIDIPWVWIGLGVVALVGIILMVKK